MNSVAEPLRPSSLFARFTDWFTRERHMTRSFSMLRILYALAMLSILLPSFPDRSYLWGPASWWVEPEAKRRGFITHNVLITKSSEFWFDISYIALIALALLFLVGFYTRFVTPVLLIMLVSLQANNPYLLNGGDVLMRITLSFMLFASLSQHYSVDAWLRKRRQSRAVQPRRPLFPPHLAHALHNAALMLGMFQIMLVYVTSAIYKLMGSEWLDGTAFYYGLTLDAFAVLPMVNELIWQSSPVIYVSTWVALWVQLLFPVMLLWRPSRITAVIAMLFMHLGIALLLSLWAFSLVMIALDLLFVRDQSWQRLGNRFINLWSSIKVARRFQQFKVNDSNLNKVGRTEA